MASIFTKIIQKQIPSYIIVENDFCVAILDAFPIQKGHILIIAKQEVNNLFDLPHNIYIEMMCMAKTVALAIQKSFPCNRVGLSVVGFEVPHAHIHLIPINHLNDINFNKLKLTFTKEEFEHIQQTIKENL